LKLMHIADLHLGAPCKSLGDMSESRRIARDSVFIRLIEVAIKEADMLIISGDLFDSHKPDEGLVASVRGAHTEIPFTHSPSGRAAAFW
jgi:exonuclease SbcD